MSIKRGLRIILSLASWAKKEVFQTKMNLSYHDCRWCWCSWWNKSDLFSNPEIFRGSTQPRSKTRQTFQRAAKVKPNQPTDSVAAAVFRKFGVDRTWDRPSFVSSSLKAECLNKCSVEWILNSVDVPATISHSLEKFSKTQSSYIILLGS